MSVNNVVDVLIGVIPLLDRIKCSLEESTGAIPRASVQLSNVSQATELATVEILNVLDAMTARLGGAEAAMEVVRAGVAQSPGHADAIRTIDTALGDTRQDAMHIAMALQVQDITAQQIAGVMEMIEQVRRQLLDVLGQLDANVPPGNAPAGVSPTAGTFDASAQYTRSDEKQQSADTIIAHWKKVHHE